MSDHIVLWELILSVLLARWGKRVISIVAIAENPCEWRHPLCLCLSHHSSAYSYTCFIHLNQPQREYQIQQIDFTVKRRHAKCADQMKLRHHPPPPGEWGIAFARPSLRWGFDPCQSVVGKIEPALLGFKFVCLFFFFSCRGHQQL